MLHIICIIYYIIYNTLITCNTLTKDLVFGSLLCLNWRHILEIMEYLKLKLIVQAYHKYSKVRCRAGF